MEFPRLIVPGVWLLLAAASGCRADAPEQAVDRAVARAAAGERLFATTREDSLLAGEQDLPTAERVGLWARRFAAAPDVRYVFGLADEGYAARGELIDDRRQDCVSLMYRCSELARARDHRDAVVWALRTRFAGAAPESLVAADGRVDYDDPHHLDFSLDMIRSGYWGDDITASLSGATSDTVGTARYPAGSFRFVPGPALQPDELRTGDIAWFVLAPDHPSARSLRDTYGMVIGHIGLVVVEAGTPWLVHAAGSRLDGWYDGGTVVRVPLLEYLSRVAKFAGIMVTRFDAR